MTWQDTFARPFLGFTPQRRRFTLRSLARRRHAQPERGAGALAILSRTGALVVFLSPISHEARVRDGGGGGCSRGSGLGRIAPRGVAVAIARAVAAGGGGAGSGRAGAGAGAGGGCCCCCQGCGGVEPRSTQTLHLQPGSCTKFLLQLKFQAFKPLSLVVADCCRLLPVVPEPTEVM